MTNSTKQTGITCPYCGEPITIVIDCSIDHQEYTEDCYVCCRPIVINAYVDDDDNISINAKSEEDC